MKKTYHSLLESCRIICIAVVGFIETWSIEARLNVQIIEAFRWTYSLGRQRLHGTRPNGQNGKILFFP